MLAFRFSKADGQMTEEETLTSGMVGKEVRLEFSPEWDGFSKTVVFTAGCESRDVTQPGSVVVIPHEVLRESRNHLYVGVYGVEPGGKVIPSIRAQGPYIHPGVDPAGDESVEPTLPVWAQLQTEMAQLREDAASVSGLSVTDDGAGNIVMQSAGNAGISHDGAGNIIITLG